jgi:undecaprenyl pyrophosphate synthase
VTAYAWVSVASSNGFGNEDLELIRTLWLRGDSMTEINQIEGSQRIIKEHFSFKLPWILNGIARKLDDKGHEVSSEILQELSIFAWSSENWSRPVGEITEAMGQFEKALDQWLDQKQSKIGYYFISTSPHKLKQAIRDKMHLLTTQTDNNNTLKVYIYVSYGFSEETRAIPTFMTEPELLIRTSGEQRLSNFCMWHLRYTELMFIKPLFPECNEEVWDSCLQEYSTRKRRFGK